MRGVQKTKRGRVSLEDVPEEEGHLEGGGVNVICLLQLLLIDN